MTLHCKMKDKRNDNTRQNAAYSTGANSSIRWRVFLLKKKSCEEEILSLLFTAAFLNFLNMTCFVARLTGPQKAEWLLRWALAVFFFFAGLGKIMGGVSVFVYQMTPGFEGSILPLALVAGFLWIVPFLEVLLGLWLFIGWHREYALWLNGILLILFLFGHKVMGDMDGIMPIFVYLLVVAGALYLPAAWDCCGSCKDGNCCEK